MRMPELLAPAGNAESLHAAICAGADAAYLGLDEFNARRNADNFTIKSLSEACDYAHLRGASVYVTMNTIILPQEMKSALECARQAYRAGADAFIVQDIGLAVAIKRNIPQARLHISTQMNIHSKEGILAAAELGASRITLARELSLPEIASLAAVAKELGMEVEVFAHGAICICYSGQCFMSSLIGGRSANRGLCAQACRLPYALESENNPGKALKTPGEYLLSPKDMCTIDDLSELMQAGVASLKIEGRMKSPEYVFSAVSTYRRALDRLADRLEGETPTGYEIDTEAKRDKESLGKVFSRGFTDGYLHGERGNDLMGYQRPNNRGQSVGRVKSVSGSIVTISVEKPLQEYDLLEVWTRKSNVRAEVGKDPMVSAKLAEVDFGSDAKKVHPNDRVFRIRAADAAFHDAPGEPRIPILGKVIVRKGEPLSMEFWPALSESKGHGSIIPEEHLGNINATSRSIIRRLSQIFQDDLPKGAAEGQIVEAARTKAVTSDEIREHIDRLGSTSFELAGLDICVDEGVGLGFSQIHKCRAEALENLEEALLATQKDRVLEKQIAHAPAFSSPSKVCRICALATNPECARAAKRAGAEDIYVPALNYKRGQAQMQGRLLPEVSQASFPKKCIPMLPTVSHDVEGFSREASSDIDVWNYVADGQPVYVDNLAQLQQASNMGAIPQVGVHLPITNRESLDVIRAYGADLTWLSPELNMQQIKFLGEASPVELGITITGVQELMITEHCELMSLGECAQNCESCSRRKVAHGLKDRKDYEFPVVTDALGRSHIYNSVMLDNVAAIPDLITAGVSAFMVDTMFMDAEQTAHAVSRAKRALDLALSGGGALPKLPNTTSGHLFRGVA